jgi:hypothetical protein
MRQRGRRGELSGLNVVDISEIARRGISARPKGKSGATPARACAAAVTYPLLSTYCIHVCMAEAEKGKPRA